MSFATRTFMLNRVNAARLAQLACPADRDMVDDEAIRIAIAGGDLSGYSEADQTTISLALDAIDAALADADALIMTYGIPETVQTTLLARIASTIALYYLQGVGRMTDDVQKAYEGVIDTLKSHSKGVLSLIPPDPALTVSDALAGAEISSGSSRYSGWNEDDGDWW